MKMIAFAAIALVALALSAPVRADSGPMGIAFAQAPEGTWWCRGADAGKTLSCALDKCRKEAAGGDCLASRWCALSGWSGLMVIWLPEFHNTVPLCGAPGEAATVEALKALCANDEVVTRCDVVVLIDPNGREKKISDLSWPGPAAASAAE